MKNSVNRRNFLKSTAVMSVATISGGSLANVSLASPAPLLRSNVNDEIGIGYIGAGIRFHSSLSKGGMKFGPCAGIADVDMVQLGRGIQVLFELHRSNKRPVTIEGHEDYRSVLDSKDVNVVFIGSPDHWHTKQVIDAMRAGKDVYCCLLYTSPSP